MSSGKDAKKWKLAKNLVQNAEFFFIIWRFPFPDVLVHRFAFVSHWLCWHFVYLEGYQLVYSPADHKSY
jgi:hypothetical protein